MDILETNEYNEWVKQVASKKIQADKHAHRISIQAARKDLTRPVLQTLLQQGYDQVVWNASATKCGTCRELHKQRWDLEDFLSNLEHDAPMAERSHPNDNGCKLIVSGPGLPRVTVNYEGRMDYAAGGSRKSPVRKTPRRAPTKKSPTPKTNIRPTRPTI